MFRYIIAIGNPKSASDCEQIEDLRRCVQSWPETWQSALDAPAMHVAYVPDSSGSGSAVALADNRGIVLGSLYRTRERFHPDPPRKIGYIPRQESEDIVDSRGRSLMHEYWGYYVAALLYPAQSCSLVMRSPVSPLACFHANLGSLTLFFCHLDDFAALELMPLSINWDSVTAQVAGGDYLTGETAIKNITSMECGECLECRPDGRSKHTYWDPRSFLRDRSLVEFSDAAQTIRNTTEYCVNALSSPHRHVLVTLSGGLDSSIVLSSLSRSPHGPTITAVNYNSRGTGDERRFARSAARTVNCKLVERVRNQALDLRRIDECNRTVRPVLNFSAPDTEARNVALARELQASAIFNGELGDNVFGSHPGPGALIECIRHLGLGRRGLSVATDYAMLKRESLWRTLASVRDEHRSVAQNPNFNSTMEMRRHYGEARARSMMLASSEAEEHSRAMGDRFVHPWLRESRLIAPGAHSLLFGLITVTSTTYHSPFSAPSDPPMVSPLVSQPLVEAALCIPAYLHCKNGQDRSIARFAFRDALPTEVIQRGLGKGGPTLWVKDVVENNCEFLREYLLSGILVRERLIDRQKLQAMLSPRIAKSTVIASEIFAKLYIEAWLRKWH
jgi:asparagine synthase (glutamine-hydrolysing)